MMFSGDDVYGDEITSGLDASDQSGPRHSMTEERFFDGLPVLPTPPDPEYSVVCPKCEGHGEYKRSPGSRVRRLCGQCVGYGYVKPGPDANCVHEWGKGVNIGRCLTEYSCTLCGHMRRVDSSD